MPRGIDTRFDDRRRPQRPMSASDAYTLIAHALGPHLSPPAPVERTRTQDES